MLAGGTSRRFGADKLDHLVAGRSLLDLVLAGLPVEADVIVVGPPRPTSRPVRFVREDPAGGGPAAALVAGLREALQDREQPVVVLPADAPGAAEGVLTLLGRLLGPDPVAAVVAVDGAGQEQPLQLALTPVAARDLVRSAGPTGAAGGSARRLVHSLEPAAVRQLLTPVELWDIDTPDELVVWQEQTSPAVRAVLRALPARPRGATTLVALDGPSGAGKSTLAAALRLRCGATVVPGDDFYAADLARLTEADRDAMTDAEVAAAVSDWPRLRREALEPLVDGRSATYRPYDWTARDGTLAAARTLPPAELVVVEGVYTARAELADLLGLTVYVGVDPAVAASRLTARGDDPGWARFWARGETDYFTRQRPPTGFDLRLTGADLRNDPSA